MVRRLGLGGAVLGLALLLALPLYQGLRGHEDSYAGLPRSQMFRPWPWHENWFHVRDMPGFVLGYSERWRNPLWVAYRLQEPRPGPYQSRPRHFRSDHRTLARVSGDDYRGSGFDRGHMAPNYAMSRFHGRDAQLASFQMSNIVPQTRALNQKLWQRLEELETDVYATAGSLWVVMGPVIGQTRERLRSGVLIPEAYFRIWVRETADGPSALAFLVPQTVDGYEPLDRFLVSVDRVEALTGLDFFHQLPEPVEQRMEQEIPARAWRLHEHSRRPPRY